MADALAWRMVAALAQQLGAQRFQAISRAVLAVRPASDARVSLFAPSLAQILAQAQAPHPALLAQQFDALFKAEQLRLASRLDLIALPPVAFSARPMSGSAVEVHYQVGKAGADEQPFSVRYVELNPWDGELAPESLARVDTARSGVLPASFARGTRLFTTVERREAQLGCSVRVAAQRWELR